MKRTLAPLTVTVLLLALLLTPAWPQEPPRTNGEAKEKSAENEVEIRRDEIKRPQDFAPPEQIVSGRDPMSFRKKGTLLALTSREIPRVAEDDLLRRKYALYNGRRFHRRPMHDPDVEEGRLSRAGLTPTVGTADSMKGRILGWIGWGLLGMIVTGVLVAWRKGWFIPFSARKSPVRHGTRKSSDKTRKSKTKDPLFKLVQRK